MKRTVIINDKIYSSAIDEEGNQLNHFADDQSDLKTINHTPDSFISLLLEDQKSHNGFGSKTKIICSNGEINVNRCILSIFSSLCRDHFADVSQMKMSVIHMEDFNIEDVRAVVSCLYSGCACFPKSRGNTIQEIFEVLCIDQEYSFGKASKEELKNSVMLNYLNLSNPSSRPSNADLKQLNLSSLPQISFIPLNSQPEVNPSLLILEDSQHGSIGSFDNCRNDCVNDVKVAPEIVKQVELSQSTSNANISHSSSQTSETPQSQTPSTTSESGSGKRPFSEELSNNSNKRRKTADASSGTTEKIIILDERSGYLTKSSSEGSSKESEGQIDSIPTIEETCDDDTERFVSRDKTATIRCYKCKKYFKTIMSLRCHLNYKKNSITCGQNLKGKFQLTTMQCLVCNTYFPEFTAHGLIEHVDQCVEIYTPRVPISKSEPKKIIPCYVLLHKMTKQEFSHYYFQKRRDILQTKPDVSPKPTPPKPPPKKRGRKKKSHPCNKAPSRIFPPMKRKEHEPLVYEDDSVSESELSQCQSPSLSKNVLKKLKEGLKQKGELNNLKDHCSSILKPSTQNPSPAQNSPVKKAPIKKVYVKKTPIQNPLIQKLPFQKTSVQNSPINPLVQKSPTQKTSVQKSRAQTTSFQKSPAQMTSVQKSPAQMTTVQKSPINPSAQKSPIQISLIQKSPAQSPLVQNLWSQQSPAQNPSAVNLPIHSPTQNPLTKTCQNLPILIGNVETKGGRGITITAKNITDIIVERMCEEVKTIEKEPMKIPNRKLSQVDSLLNNLQRLHSSNLTPSEVGLVLKKGQKNLLKKVSLLGKIGPISNSSDFQSTERISENLNQTLPDPNNSQILGNSGNQIESVRLGIDKNPSNLTNNSFYTLPPLSKKNIVDYSIEGFRLASALNLAMATKAPSNKPIQEKSNLSLPLSMNVTQNYNDWVVRGTPEIAVPEDFSFANLFDIPQQLNPYGFEKHQEFDCEKCHETFESQINLDNHFCSNL